MLVCLDEVFSNPKNVFFTFWPGFFCIRRFSVIFFRRPTPPVQGRAFLFEIHKPKNVLPSFAPAVWFFPPLNQRFFTGSWFLSLCFFLLPPWWKSPPSGFCTTPATGLGVCSFYYILGYWCKRPCPSLWPFPPPSPVRCSFRPPFLHWNFLRGLQFFFSLTLARFFFFFVPWSSLKGFPV